VPGGRLAKPNPALYGCRVRLADRQAPSSALQAGGGSERGSCGINALPALRFHFKITRIASGSFVWTIESDNNPFGLPAGIYDAASEGLWVYLRKGLPEGEYEIEFGGDFPNVGFRQKITYNPIVV
jgi:hypothetical protein